MATTIELHDTDVPIHALALSTSTTTPVKNSSHNATSEKKEQVREKLWSEMNYGGWVKDTGLIDRFMEFGSTSKPKSTLPKSCKTEAKIYGPLVKLFNELAFSSSLAFVQTSAHYPRQSRDSSHLNDQLPEFNPIDNCSQSELRPDILGMHQPDVDAFLRARVQGADTWLYWKLVRVFCEVKLGNSPSEWLDGREQAALYARQASPVFRNHPGRRFVYGIVWCHPKFEVWLFDRSGGVVSDQYDFTAGSHLSCIIAALSQFDDASMGYDPSFVLPAVDPSVRPKRTQPHQDASITFSAQDSHIEETFLVERELFCRMSLRGRGTQVWLVKRDSDGERFVLKDSWREVTRPRESDWYKIVAARHPNLPDVYRHCTVTIDGKDDTTELCRGGCGTLDENNVWLPTVQRRVHERILFSKYGLPLWESQDFSELLRVIKGAVQAHRILYRSDILHRDISINNILIEGKSRTGFLIDLDHAAKVMPDSDPSDSRSGTVLFMAAEVLAGIYFDPNDPRPFRHGVEHDLESFVFVILYLAVASPGYELARAYLSKCLQLHTADLHILALAKEAFFTDRIRQWSQMQVYLGSHPLWPFIDKLRKARIGFSGKEARYEDLYVNFLDILEPSPTLLAGPQSHKRPLEPSFMTDGSHKRVKTAVAWFSPANLRTRTCFPNYHEFSDSESFSDEGM